jgi:hypothetical protein
MYLLEPGIDLWLTLIRLSPELSIRLFELFSYWPSILSRDAEYLHQLLEILESYILLGGEEFVLKISGVVGATLSELIRKIVVHISLLMI